MAKPVLLTVDDDPEVLRAVSVICANATPTATAFCALIRAQRRSVRWKL
jgi:hypothetical protein